MAELNQLMDIDPRLPVLPQQYKEVCRNDFLRRLDALAIYVYRFSMAFSSPLYYKRSKLPEQEHVDVIAEIRNQLEQCTAEKNSLSDIISQQKEDIAQCKKAINERDARNKQLQRVIIESTQNINPPMDDEIIDLFNELNHDIMRVVKRHFTKSLVGDSDRPNWKEYKSLSPENRELWIRAWFADEL